MFKHFKSKMLEKETDLTLSPEDLKEFKANQAASFKAFIQAGKWENGVKLKRKQK